MREIVVGQMGVGPGGIQLVNVWFRVAVPAQRQPFYAAARSAYVPLAPDSNGGNAYTRVDAPNGINDPAEVTAFRNGTWLELSGFYDVVDPTSNLAAIQTRLQNIYAKSASTQGTADTAALANWASDWDGTAWHMKFS